MCLPVAQPLFLLLPLLEKSSSHFVSREQLLFEDHHFNALQSCANLKLDLVCDVKSAGDDSYYKLNPQKLEAWLKSKVLRTQEVLCSRRIAGSHQVGC